MITNKVEQMERWVEHYSELYSREKVVVTSAMDASAHHGGVRSYTNTGTYGKAPGNDGISQT